MRGAVDQMNRSKAEGEFSSGWVSSHPGVHFRTKLETLAQYEITQQQPGVAIKNIIKVW